ncbi:MAG: hypothetical protein ACI4SG_03430 [Oligosphaeraceae bacterium]
MMNQARRFGNYCQRLGWSDWFKCHRDRLKAGMAADTTGDGQ